MMKIPKSWKSWELWFHYMLLTGVVFIAHHYSGFLEEKVVAAEPNAWLWLFVWYTVWIALGDQLIHYILHQLTGWKD